MATAIATIPVLTGEVAERFEAKAQAAYEKYLNRTPEEERSVRERYEKGMELVRKVLAKSDLGKKL
jgi:predicted DNA-binding protein YlxM (UPF0122 family)